MASTKLEIAVRMTCQSCVDSVKQALTGVDGIESVGVDLGVERVVVVTTLPSQQVLDRIESTGRRAVLAGMGSERSVKHLGAAVSEMSGLGAMGVVRMVQTDPDSCVIEGTLDGLRPGQHHLYVHEYGDLSQGCNSCGDIFDMTGDVQSANQKYGDLGPVTASEDGRAQFRLVMSRLKVWDIIGRSMVIHDATQQRKEAEDRVACGIIARSAGLFENAKRFCACDGVTIWDERDKPVAGEGRQREDQIPNGATLYCRYHAC